jgi:hypothetical protein
MLEDSRIVDTSFKDMSLYYKPDFRAIPVNQYKTLNGPDDKQREANFKMTISIERLKSKIDKKIIKDPLGRGSPKIKEPYIEGHEIIGQ